MATLLVFVLVSGCDRAPDTSDPESNPSATTGPTSTGSEEAELCADAVSEYFVRNGTCYSTNATFCGTERQHSGFSKALAAANAKLKAAGFRYLSEIDVKHLCNNCRQGNDCPAYFDFQKYRK